jgi:hypothetical protein
MTVIGALSSFRKRGEMSPQTRFRPDKRTHHVERHQLAPNRQVTH